MDARDIPSKWVVSLGAHASEPPVWLGWATLARLLEGAIELSTEPNTYARVTFPEATLATLGELLAHVEECHAAPGSPASREHPHKLAAERLSSAANELHERAGFLAEALARPGETQMLSGEQLKAREDIVAEWKTLQYQLGMGAAHA